jgi:hypothetical protein
MDPCGRPISAFREDEPTSITESLCSFSMREIKELSLLFLLLLLNIRNNISLSTES